MTDDFISRQKAIDALIDALNDVGVLDAEDINTVFRMLPPEQPERIKARWLPIGMADAVGGESAMWGDEIAYHACDNCWQQALEKDGEEVLSDFCPHCGAEMMKGDVEC